MQLFILVLMNCYLQWNIPGLLPSLVHCAGGLQRSNIGDPFRRKQLRLIYENSYASDIFTILQLLLYFLLFVLHNTSASPAWRQTDCADKLVMLSTLPAEALQHSSHRADRPPVSWDSGLFYVGGNVIQLRKHFGYFP